MYSMNDKSALKQLIDADEFSNKLNLDRKTYGLVFDKRTLNSIYYIIKKFNIDFIDFPISSGKESLVFKVIDIKRKAFALKIYKMSTLKFRHRDYRRLRGHAGHGGSGRGSVSHAGAAGAAAIHRRAVGNAAQRALCDRRGFAAGRHGSARAASADEAVREFGKTNIRAHEGLV